MLNLLSSSLPAIVDIVVVAFILLFAILGFVKGFINTFIKSFGTIISLVVAALLCATSVNFLESEFSLVSDFSEKLIDTVNSLFGEELMSRPLVLISEEMLREQGIAGWIVSNIIKIKENGFPFGATLGSAVSQVFSYYIILVIIFIVLFVILKILFFLISKFVIKLHEKRIIGTTDRILGIFLGTIKGILFVQFLMFIIQIIPIGFVQDLSLVIENSVVAGFISDINIYGIVIDSIKTIHI